MEENTQSPVEEISDTAEGATVDPFSHPADADDSVVDAEIEPEEGKPEIRMIHSVPEVVVTMTPPNWTLPENLVEIELEHFRLTDVPADPAEIGGGHLAGTLAMLSEILELRQAVLDLTSAIMEDRKRIRRLERQSSGPGMGGGGFGLMPTPLAVATANGEPEPDHLRTPIDLDAVRASTEKNDD